MSFWDTVHRRGVIAAKEIGETETKSSITGTLFLLCVCIVFIHSSAFSICFIPIILMCSCRILIKITYLLSCVVAVTNCLKDLGCESAVPLTNSVQLADRLRIEYSKQQSAGSTGSDACPFRFGSFLLARDSAYATMSVSVCLSICPSVCPSLCDGSAFAHYS